MKQLNFKTRFVILLLGFLTIGISQVWGEDVVNNISNLSAGKYYITAFNSGTYYTVPNTTINGQTFTCTAGTYSSGKFTAPEGAGVFQFISTGTANQYYIYNDNLKKYLVATASQKFGYVDNSSSDYGYWTFSNVGTNAGISGKFSVQHSSKTHYMRAYSNSVKCYDGASNQGVYLMKAASGSSIEINPTNSNLATDSYADKTIEVNDITFGYTQWYKNTQNPFNIQAAKSKTNSLYNVDAIPGIIKSITFVQTGTARAIKVYGGTSTKPTTEITAPTTNATMTFNFSGKEYTYFSMTTPGNACYFDKITIEYEAAPDCKAPDTELSVFASPTSITTDESATLSTNGGNGGTVSYEVTSSNKATASITGNSFTATAAGTYTITASQPLTGGKCAQTAATDITVTLPTYSVAWKVNGKDAQGSPTTSVQKGGKVSALPTEPTTSDCDGSKVFVGWTAHEGYEDADDAPDDLFKTATNAPIVNGNTTYYAVYADAEEGSGPSEKTVTLDFNAKKPSLTISDKTASAEVDNYIFNFAFTDGNTVTQYSDASTNTYNEIRMYVGSSTNGSTTITSPSFISFKSVEVFATSKNNTTAGTGKVYVGSTLKHTQELQTATSTSSGEITLGDNVTSIKLECTAGQYRIQKLIIKGEINGGGVIYSNYITECCSQPTNPLAITTVERTVTLGGSTLTLATTAGNGGAKVWESSDEDIATVENGVVTPLKKGTTTISVSQAAKGEYCEQYVEVEIEVISASEFGISFTEVTGGSAVAKIGDEEVTKAETEQEVTILASENPGYEFTSWAATGVTIATPTENPTTFTMGSEAVIITPSFGYKTYNIIYKDKGGADYSGSNSEDLVKTHTYNTATTLVDGTKEGATFMGWYTNEACTGEPLTTLQALSYTQDITLYAKWGYEVKFYNNADQIGETRIIEVGTVIGALPEQGEMISCNEDGSDTFMGWMIGKITGSQDNAPTFVQSTDVVNSALDIYAVWAKGTAQGEPVKHTVTWNINGIQTPASGAKANTPLLISSITPDGASGTWTAVSTNDTYAQTQDQKAQLGSGSYWFTGTLSLSNSSIPSSAQVTKVTMTCNSSAGSGSYYTVGVTIGNQTFGTANHIYDNSKTYTWTGTKTGNDIVFNIDNTYSSKKNIQISTITVEYSVAALVYSQYITNCSDLVKPEFTIAEGSYYKSQTFGLTQSQGKAIFYTIDGSDPKEQGKGTAYQNPFTLSETATIKARATDGYGDWSSLATCTYTIYPTYTSIPAIQNAVEATEANATIEISDPWLITAIFGTGVQKTYAYAINTSKQGLLMYTVGGHGFEVGDKFTGAADESIKKDNGAPRVNGIKASKMSVTHNNPVDATEVTSFSTITATNHSALVTLMNAQANVSGDIVTLSDGTTSLTFTDKFGTGLTASDFINTARYNVTGIIMLNGTTIQIAPRTTADVEWIHGTLDDPKNPTVVEVGTTKASLTWDAVENISSYLVTYNGATTNVSTNAVNLTGLTSNADYTWSVQAIGDGISYLSSNTIDGEPFHTLNPLDVKHSITYHANAGTVDTEAAKEVADGYTFTYPNVDLTCSGGFIFAGWTDQSDFEDGTAAPEHFYAANTTSNPVGEDIDLYAVYKKGTTNTLNFAEFVADPSITEADFVIAAKLGDNDYRPVPKTGYSSTSSGSTVAAGTTITDITDVEQLKAAKIKIKKATSGYNLEYSTGMYVVGASNSGTSLKSVTTAPTTGWTLATGDISRGSYRLTSAISSARHLRFNAGTTNKFGNYTTTVQSGQEDTYYDLEIIGIPVSSTQYTLTPDCRTERALVLESSEGETFRLNEKSGAETSDNITVTFSAQEGTGSEGEITLSLPSAYEGVTVDNTNKTVKFTKTGTYLIKADQAATQDYQAVSASLSVTVQKALNTLSYDANGGENAPADQTDENGKQVEVAGRGEMTNGIKAFSCWNTQADGSGQNYNPGNKYTLNGSATLYAVWVDALSVTIDSTIEHGTITATPQYALQSDQITLTIEPDEGYTLVPNSVIVTKENGGIVNFNTKTNTFYMPSENVTVTATFAIGALYTIDGWDSSTEKLATSQEGEPAGSSYSLTNTYPTATNHQHVDQITSGNKITLTLSGYDGKFITGITMSMHSNANDGVGTFSAKVGNQDAFASISSNTKFDQWFDNTSCGTSYRPVHVTLPQDHYVYVGENEDVVIELACTTNSLFCESFFIEYVDGYRRDMSNGFMGTHCYPFDIAAGDYRGAQFYEIAYRIGDTRIYFDQVDQVEAGVPYLVVPEDEENGSILEAIVTPKDVPAGTSKGFIGSYTQEKLEKSENLYIVYNNEFRRVGNNVFVGANRAYIDLTQVTEDDPQQGVANAPRRISLRNSEGATPTGINNIHEEFGNPNGGAMKVFHDGNIYFIRESKIYNAQGAELK